MLIKKIGEAGRLVGRDDGHQFRSGCVVLKPGEEVGEHSTEKGEELIIILEGTARVIAADEAEDVDAPSLVVIPPHTIHNVKNESYKMLRYVYNVAIVGEKSTK